MPTARFTEEQLQDILSKLKVTLFGKIQECKHQTSNVGQRIVLAGMEKALKYPDTVVGGDTVHKLNTYQGMLNEVNGYLTALEEAQLTGRSRMAA
jgi:uncharacterized protein (UPF0210 family)